MFVPIETSGARTVWIDSIDENQIGFADSSRVEIRRSNTAFGEEGDAFEAHLLGGMWPDDDELMLLAVGVPPATPQAHEYLLRIGELHLTGEVLTSERARVPGTEPTEQRGMERLREMVSLMPAWSGQMTRSILVAPNTPRLDPESMRKQMEEEKEKKASFDSWRLNVDVKMSTLGAGSTDDLEVPLMQEAWEKGMTPEEFVATHVPMTGEASEV